MARVDEIRERLERAFRTSPYHSFLGSIKGVSEDDAVWTPPGYRGFPHMTGSMLSLAYHTGGDKHVLISTAFGDGSIGWPQVQARFEALGGTLAAARTLADEGHALVVRTLDGLTDADLDEPRPYYRSKTYPAAEIFAIIAEHDYYHAGQINYIRNLLAGYHASG